MTAVDRRDKVAAHQRAQTIRDGLMSFVNAMDAISEAYERKDWRALGYKNWVDYCQTEFGQSRLKLNQEQRAQAIGAFKGVGMSKRGIAAALGVDPKTIRNDSRSGEKSPLPAKPPSGGVEGTSPEGVTQDSPAAADPASQQRVTQPGPDSSTEASEASTVEAPAEPTPSDVAEVVPSVATSQPGVDRPSAAGEASKDAGAQSEPVAAGSDESERSVPPPADLSDDGPELDPASAWMAHIQSVMEACDQLDYDVVGPMLTAEELGLIDAAAGVLRSAWKLLSRWSDQPAP